MTMNPYLSWALLLVVAGGLGWYYTNGSTPKAKTAIRSAVEKPEVVAAPKKQKRKTKASEPAAAKKPEVKTVVSPPTTEDEKPDEDIDRKEMARRLASIKNGTSQVAAPVSKSQKKKQKKATQLESGSHASSTTGAEADDDLSPAPSPQVNATVPSAGYVSDMLEAPAPGASVLRVTGNMESEPKKQKAQSFKQVETKKQRQQRLKNEARKEQVQEAEEQRRKLLEKQLHTARDSERKEAARSQPPTSNAWQAKDVTNVTNGTSRPAPAAPVQLLDTFEPTTAAPAQKKWAQGLPSEEEQMRMLGAENVEDEWTTVSSKKPKKKGGKADESVSEASASESQPAPATPIPIEPRVTVTPTYIPDILRSREKGHPLDSDWAA
ncbi:hypothetical protein N7462_005574 [Penicillium macrosclerotiorum]|uniref:uncharacterized protein n=1 Tax=Penicillium macrosclerotiorum TaxID=303699 RepID=UPI0025499521|nr:uncharacterized protein N7462_005574 [Penicillium macrosclerotiorum]KAJ5682409.1 hypothetical protein N7462_005574 [Penicillium macrosclerotiorum]